jgi:hypothetical protein
MECFRKLYYSTSILLVYQDLRVTASEHHELLENNYDQELPGLF